MDIGGDEGGVCMDPAIAGVKAPLAQCAAAALWWSPFNLSGGVNIPPPAPSSKIKTIIKGINLVMGVKRKLLYMRRAFVERFGFTDAKANKGETKVNKRAKRQILAKKPR